MKHHEEISHEGLVESNTGGTVNVRITPGTACSGCHAAGSCNLSTPGDKVISVEGDYSVKAGDRVSVIMDLSQGFNAVILVYLVPFCILVAALVAFSSFTADEAIAGVVSLGTLVPYYFILYLFRKRIGKRYTFRLKTL